MKVTTNRAKIVSCLNGEWMPLTKLKINTNLVKQPTSPIINELEALQIVQIKECSKETGRPIHIKLTKKGLEYKELIKELRKYGS